MPKSRLGLWSIILVTIALPSCNELINFPAPVLAALSPASYTAGQPPAPLIATGNGFTPSSVVELSFNGGTPTPRTTIFNGNVHQLTATLLASDVQNPAEISVTVFTPQPGGGTSEALILTVVPLSSPTPKITSISPSSVLVGNSGFTLTVAGTGFVALSQVTVNGTSVSSALQNSNTLLAAVPSTMLLFAGTLDVSVVNPTSPPPGGGNSNIVELTVANPAPTISAVSPTSAQAGGTAPTVSVTGTNFVIGSQVLVNGTPRVSSLASGSLSTQLTAGDIVGGGIDQIQVANPAPGGGVSNILPFAVTPTPTEGLPVLVDVDPDGSQPNNAICGTTCSGTTPDLTNAGPSTSNSGTFVAFASNSTTLISTETTTGSNVFLRGTCLGTASCTPITLIESVGLSGSAASGASTQPVLNKGSGGPFLAFTSTATNLVASAPVSGTHRQVYWRSACTTATACASAGTSSATLTAFLVSASADGTSEGNGDSFSPAISPDGRYVAFVSLATNLVSSIVVDGVTPQVYVTDTCNGTTTTTTGQIGCTPKTLLVSSPDGMTPGNAASSTPAVSNDGLFVSFTSSATNLGVTPLNAGGVAQIFERSTCITGDTACDETTTLVSSPDGVAPGNGASDNSGISMDGRFISFASTATNVIAGVGPVQQIYRIDTCTGQTPALCTPSILLISTPNGTSPAIAPAEHPDMDPTGQFVTFASLASNLSPNAANGVENIYVRNTCTGTNVTVSGTTTTCTVGIVLVSQPAGTSPAPANNSSNSPSISGDGKSVSFISGASNLVTGDTNNSPDIFLGATTFTDI